MRPSNLRPCGTVAAYRRHLRQGEKPCDACTAAQTATSKTWRKTCISHRPQLQRPRAKCGTDAGYQAHHKKGEPPCQTCRTANLQNQKDLRQGKRSPRTLQPCGTAAAWIRHQKANETCQLCKDAYNRRGRERYRPRWT